MAEAEILTAEQEDEGIVSVLYLDFVRATPEQPRKTEIWEIYSRRDRHMKLGTISWFGRWRQYVFQAESEHCVFNKTCLDHIAWFCGILNAQHSKALRERPKISAKGRCQ